MCFGKVHGDIVLFTVGHERLSGVQVPLSPRRNHLNTGFQGIGAQLKAHLVIPFTGCTMRDGIGTGLIGNFDQSLSNQRPGDGSAKQILTLIYRIGTEHGKHEIAHKGFLEIFNINLLHTQCLRLGASGLNFLTLANIGSESHHFTLVGFLQPAHDHRGIQPPRVREHNLIHRCHNRA